MPRFCLSMNLLLRRVKWPAFKAFDLFLETLGALCALYLRLAGSLIMTTEATPPVITSRPKESKFASVQKNACKLWNQPPLPIVPIKNCLSPMSTKPVSGVKAEKGKRSKMEDTYTIQENLIELHDYMDPLGIRFPDGMDDDDALTLSREDPLSPQSDIRCPLKRDVFHFYGVYDGHGGMEASKHCASRMHDNLRSAWNNLHSDDCGMPECSSDEENCMNDPDRSTTSEDIVEIFERAFKLTDDEFKETTENAEVVGSTAVTALIGARYIITGYCGDSRAVLCRNKRAFPLTVDHKPERDDETERVQKAGGQVLFFNGPRVMGLLAMSRAIGDQSLRPYVIPTPDVCVLHRSVDDELLILATDGLWDVLTNQEACTLALKCLNRAKEKGARPEEATRLTATVLTRAAMDRGSRDNITVVVVDLRSGDDFVQSVPSSENDSPCNAPDTPDAIHRAA